MIYQNKKRLDKQSVAIRKKKERKKEVDKKKNNKINYFGSKKLMGKKKHLCIHCCNTRVPQCQTAR